MANADPPMPGDVSAGDTRPDLQPGPETTGPVPGADAPARPSLKAGDVLAGRFRVERLLGKGGMGEVYLAEDVHLERNVALKLLSPDLARDPQYLQRFRREARAASALSHPHVCMILEVDETEAGAPFIAMEYLEGK